MQHKIKTNGHELLLIDYPANSTSYRLVSREDDVEMEKLAQDHIQKMYPQHYVTKNYPDSNVGNRYDGFISGYRTAKENSYSEDFVIGLLDWIKTFDVLQKAYGEWFIESQIESKELFHHYLATLPSKSIQFMSEGEKYLKEADMYRLADAVEKAIGEYRIPRVAAGEFIQSLKEVTLQNQIIETVPLPEGSVVLGEVKEGKVDFDCSELVDDTFKKHESVSSLSFPPVLGKKILVDDYNKICQDSFLSKLKTQSIDTEKHYLVIKIKNEL